MGDAGFPRSAGLALVAVVGVVAVATSVVCASAAEPRCVTGAGGAATPLDITLSATLTGTLIVDGGRSLALFDPTGVIGVMREGDAFADGTVLCEVRSDRIIVERVGMRSEILVGEKGRPTAAGALRTSVQALPEGVIGAPPAAPGVSPLAVTAIERSGAAPAARQSLVQLRAAKFHAMLQQRQPPSIQ
ncbi:MAG TPA: hypothetical protein VI078_08890 [bacterium]